MVVSDFLCGIQQSRCPGIWDFKSLLPGNFFGNSVVNHIESWINSSASIDSRLSNKVYDILFRGALTDTEHHFTFHDKPYGFGQPPDPGHIRTVCQALSHQQASGVLIHRL